MKRQPRSKIPGHWSCCRSFSMSVTFWVQSTPTSVLLHPAHAARRTLTRSTVSLAVADQVRARPHHRDAGVRDLRAERVHLPRVAAQVRLRQQGVAHVRVHLRREYSHTRTHTWPHARTTATHARTHRHAHPRTHTQPNTTSHTRTHR